MDETSIPQNPLLTPVKPPASRFYTSWQIGVGTILGGPLAGGYLFAQDHKAFGSPKKAKWALFWSVSILLMIVASSFYLPSHESSSNVVVAGVIAGMYRWFAQKNFDETIAQRREQGWVEFSWWRVVSIGLASILVTFAIAFPIVWATIQNKQMRMNESKIVEISVADVPRVLSKVTAAQSEPAFGVFIFQPPGQQVGDEFINLQFSLEHGKPGFDFVLLGPLNIKDEKRFTEFVRAAGYVPEKREMNGVKYVRVENGDLVKLCGDVITSMYGLSEKDNIGLLPIGFEW